MSGDELDPRVGELLSAALDGAVDDEQRAAVDEWLRRSAAARAEHEALAAVKRALAELPAVEPPAGFFDAMLERGNPAPVASAASALAFRRRARRRSPAMLVASALATAASWVVVAGAPPGEIRPPIEDVAAAAVLGTASFDDVTLHRADGGAVAVLRQEGAVDWDELPSGDRDRIGSASVWVDRSAPPRVARVIVVRDGAVYTLASDDLDAGALAALGADLASDGEAGEPGDGWRDRVRRAAASLVEAMSIG